MPTSSSGMLGWIHISEKERLYANVFWGKVVWQPIICYDYDQHWTLTMTIEHWETKVKEGWLSGSGWNPPRGKLGAPEKQALYHSCYVEEEAGGGEDVPQRGVAATATAGGVAWRAAWTQ